MTLLEHDQYENGSAYAIALAKSQGPRALIGEAARLQARDEARAFVEGFADEAVRVACLEEQRQARLTMEAQDAQRAA